MNIINGKHYPLWQQFVDKKDEWIGGELIDIDHGHENKTTITDISLKPNGDDSAYFKIHGEKFDCGFDVHYGGITGDGHHTGYLHLSGFYGHTFKIKKASK